MKQNKTITATIRFLFLYVFFAHALSGRAATLHVAPDGNDANDGTSWEQAFETIGAAVAAANPAGGDTVVVSNGTYTLSSVITITNATSVVSLNGDAETIVTGTTGNNPFFALTHDDAVLDGFRLTGGASTGTGGAVRLDKGTLLNCFIDDTTCNFGAVFMRQGTLMRNCVLFNNRGLYAGAVYMNQGGTIENCTIYGNIRTTSGLSSGYSAGIAFRHQVGTVRNTVAYGNFTQDFPVPLVDNWSIPPSMNNIQFDFSCTIPKPSTGEGNLDGSPLFVDAFNGNLRLQGASPGIDAGTNLLWTTESGALDIAGAPRIQNEIVDMGAYEGAGSDVSVSFSITPDTGVAPLDVEMTASSSGNTTDLYYRWSFTNALVVDAEGYDLAVVTNTYDIGFHSPYLLVSNTVGGVAAQHQQYAIHAGVATTYVSQVSTPVYPYGTWETAADDIQTAINSALPGSVVLVAPGHYKPAALPITLHKPLTLRSRDGYTMTVLDADGKSAAVLDVDAIGALVEEFTMTGVNNAIPGALNIRAGVVQYCHITDNATQYGAVFLGSTDSVLRNSLVDGNTANFAGAVWMNANGLIEGCTLTRNIGGRTGGIWFRHNSGTVRYSIFYDNEHTDNNIDPNWIGTRTVFEYSCTTPDPNGTGNVFDDPAFVAPLDGDYRLQPGSPGIDTGMTPAWAMAPGVTDLAGNPRIIGDGIDMGALENLQLPVGTMIILR